MVRIQVPAPLYRAWCGIAQVQLGSVPRQNVPCWNCAQAYPMPLRSTKSMRWCRP